MNQKSVLCFCVALSFFSSENCHSAGSTFEHFNAVKKLVAPMSQYQIPECSSDTKLLYKAGSEAENFTLHLAADIICSAFFNSGDEKVPVSNLLAFFSAFHSFCTTKASVIAKEQSGGKIIKVKNTTLISMVPQVWSVLKDTCLRECRSFADYRTHLTNFIIGEVGNLNVDGSGKLSGTKASQSPMGETFFSRIHELFHPNDDRRCWSYFHQRDYFNVPFNMKLVLAYTLSSLYVGIHPVLLATSYVVHEPSKGVSFKFEKQNAINSSGVENFSETAEELSKKDICSRMQSACEKRILKTNESIFQNRDSVKREISAVVRNQVDKIYGEESKKLINKNDAEGLMKEILGRFFAASAPFNMQALEALSLLLRNSSYTDPDSAETQTLEPSSPLRSSRQASRNAQSSSSSREEEEEEIVWKRRDNIVLPSVFSIVGGANRK